MTIKNYDQVVDEIEASIAASLGPVDTDPDSPLGAIISPFALQAVDAYQQVDDVTQSLSPSSASGQELNRVCALIGLTRWDATATTVQLALGGTTGVLVPAGSTAKSDVDQNVYEVDADTTINKADSVKNRFLITTTSAGTEHSVIFNSTITASYTSTGTDTLEVASQLSALIVAQTDFLNVEYGEGEVTDTAYIECTASDRETPYAVDVVQNVALETVWTPAMAKSQVLGKIACPALSITVIDSPVAGWKSVTNLKQGQRGRAVESDLDFRIRRLQSFLMLGGATPQGLRSKILNFVDGVSFCRVYENPTGVVDEFGRPPHSINVVAEGGTDQDVADMIYANKAGGVDTFGNVTVQVTTPDDTLAVNFDRPSVLCAWVRVTITEKNFEEVFPPDGIDAVRQSLYDFATSEFSYGDDLIVQKLYTPVYSVPGIKNVTVEVATTELPTDTPVFQSTNISIPPTTYTDWLNDASRIVVVDNS